MVPSIVSSVEMMLERWNDHLGEEVEVFEEFTLLTAEDDNTLPMQVIV
ncbi:hypothetical protein LINPERPRIM_LOCUS35437 [Linum perenne]